MKNATRLLALALCLMLVFTACGGGGGTSGGGDSTGARKTDPDSFHYALNVEPAKLDPQDNGFLAGMTIQKMIFDTLITRDLDGNFHPSLATEWEYLDDLTLRFKLRDDVYWHDGEKLTAEDVKYTIQRTNEIANSKALFAAFDGDGSVVVDEYTIDIKFHFPSASALNFLATTRGQIVPKHYIEANGADYFARNPMGSGAFVFEEWITGDRVTCVRNDNYWGNAPVYSKFVARFIIETATRTIELESGGVDAIGDVVSDDVERLKNAPGCDVVTGMGFRHSNFAFDMEDPVFSDIKVRQAIAHALDMEAIVNATYKSTGVVGDSVFASTVFGYQSQGVYEYDPELAKSLLEEAGYGDGLDIAVAVADEQVTIDVCEIAQNMWAAVGINCKIEVYDQATLSDKSAAREYAFTVATMVPGSGDPDHAMLSLAPTATGITATKDPVIIDFLERGKAELDEDARKEIYYEFQKYMHDNYVQIPIAFGVVSYGIRDYVEGFGFNPGNIPDLKDITFKS